MSKFIELLKKNKKYVLIIFLIVIFLYYLVWAISNPYNVSPDEGMKYDVCKYIYNHGSLPHGGDEEIRNESWGISYAFQPILTYIFSAIFMKIFSLFTTNEFALVIAARLPCILFMVGFIYFVIKIAKKLFKGIYSYLFIALIAFLPQIAFLSSYINNDALALFATAMIIYAWILGCEQGLKNKICIFLGIGIGICLLSYYNAYGYILCSVLICLAYAISNKMNWKTILKKALIVVAVAFLVAGWWFIRNAIIYDGDFLGLSTETKYGDMYAIDEYKPSTRPTIANEGKSLLYMFTKERWIILTLKSYIATFGVMSLEMPNYVYLIFILIWLISFIGIILKFKDLFILKKEEKNKYILTYTMILAMIIPVILSIYYSYTSDFQAQGRYIMSMIIPFNFFIVYGIKSVLEKVVKKEKYRNLIVIILIIILILISLISIFGYIIPSYHFK